MKNYKSDPALYTTTGSFAKKMAQVSKLVGNASRGPIHVPSRGKSPSVKGGQHIPHQKGPR